MLWISKTETKKRTKARCLGATWRWAPDRDKRGEDNDVELSLSLNCLQLWVVLFPKILMRHINFCYDYHDIRMQQNDDYYNLGVLSNLMHVEFRNHRNAVRICLTQVEMVYVF